MSQITFSDLVNGIYPDASDFNTRYNALKNRINNGMEADNISDSAVTTAKINNGAVTYAKFDSQVVAGATTVVAATDDFAFISDTSDSGNVKKSLVSNLFIPTVVNALAGSIVQMVITMDATSSSITPATGWGDDNTTPLWDEGSTVAALDTTITPTNSSNDILVIAMINGSRNSGNGGMFAGAMFKDPTGSQACISTGKEQISDDNSGIRSASQVFIVYKESAGSLSARTFKFRLCGSGTSTIDYCQDSAGGDYGNTRQSIVIAMEIKR